MIPAQQLPWYEPTKVRYQITADVPRKYIDVNCSCESSEDLVEFWGAVAPSQFTEWHVEDFEVEEFGILNLKHYRDDDAIGIYLYDRDSMPVDFEVSIPAGLDDDEAADWVTEKLPGDWHVDEIIPVSALDTTQDNED